MQIFGPLESLSSDECSSLVGNVAKNLTEMSEIGGMQAYAYRPQTNGTVERWNKTLTRDIACSMAAGDSTWDEHVALACFRYNKGVCPANDTTLFKAVSGVEALPV